MLSQIGCITIPEETLVKVFEGKSLMPDELSMLQAHPQVGHDLICRIPRLELVAQMIAHQESKFCVSEAASDDQGKLIPAGARILKVALDFDKLIEGKLSSSEAFKEIQRRSDWYEPSAVQALGKVVASSQPLYDSVYVKVHELIPDMILAADVMSVTGFLLVAKGQEVTLTLGTRLENYLMRGGIEEPIKVFVPIETLGYRRDDSPLLPGREALVS